MNNPTGASDVALTVMGGVVPEMDASELPEGASAGTQDTDFSPGSVFTRGGRVGQYTFAGLFSEKISNFVQSLPGPADPNETAWVSPMNATHGIPGSYASVALNTSVATTPGTLAFDQAVTNFGTGTVVSTPSIAPSSAPSWGLFFITNDGSLPTPGGSWSNYAVSTHPFTYAQYLATVVPVAGAATIPASNWCAALLTFNVIGGGIPTLLQNNNFVSGAWNTPQTGSFANPLTAGSTLVIMISANAVSTVTGMTVTDTAGNIYTKRAHISGTNCQLDVWVASNVAAGSPTIQLGAPIGGPIGGANWRGWEIQAGVLGSPSNAVSQILQASNFAFSVPTTASVLGFVAEISGHQSTQDPAAILTLSLVNPSATSPSYVFQLPSVDATSNFPFGANQVAVLNWGLALTPAVINNPNFAIKLIASALDGAAVTFSIYAIKLKVFLAPAPPCNFNWIKTYEQTNGEIDTLALDANGLLWDEDVDTSLSVLTNISTNINPGSYAKSVTFNDVEYIGISDLSNGTDVPRLWNGRWLDRVSQVGPGSSPSFATSASGANVQSITQNASTVLPVGVHDWLLVSAGPSAQGTFGTPATPGNVVTIQTRAAFVRPSYIVAGSNIQISGFPLINGLNINNDPTGVTNPAFYTVTSLIPPNPGFQSFNWITFQIPFTTFYNQQTPPGCNIQATVATLTASQQVPFLEVGNQFTLSGVVPAGWNNTFVVTATPNASQLSISQTSLSGNAASYVFTLITGTAPVVGQFVTVTGTLNGGGIFNVTNAVIISASPTQFSISLVGPNVNPVAETGNGIISGTIFQFDPAGTVTNPIVGNAGPGGTISTSGVIGVGTRSAVCIFLTRNAALTATSPPVNFNVTLTASSIVASSIPIGPPNVVARIIAFTGANGGNYFWIPQPVTVTTNGQQITYPATVINDNITTQVTLSFPDAVLLAATAIDVQGNNLFEQIELGSPVGFLSYSDRLIAWQEQNKIQNLLNLSFDGGIGVFNAQQQATLPSVTTYPLGWTVDQVNGGGGSVIVSPIFGNSYYVKNSTGGLQALYGMIEQGAYQDSFQVPIITTSTLYSVRVTARCPSGAVSGNLVMDLFSPKLNQVFGSFAVGLASMSSVMKIFTGTLLTTAFTTVPKDLQFRVYLQNVPNNGDVELDRVEPFPTDEPVFSTSFTASYVSNPEAFDLITGHFGPSQNQQPIRGGMVLFDTLYALKTKSWYSTNDNGTTEPNFWNWREVSNKIGTIGSHSYDYGEDWAFTACRAGVYFFNGGEPLRVSQEIAPVWDLVNWSAGQSIWLRNDSEQRKLYVGVPIATPNIYMPEFPINANPVIPNVILMMNYRELNSGMAVADTPPIRSSFSGRLLAPEPARKWSFWNIQSPYADFIDRGNNTTPLFLCNGYQNSKVYRLMDTELDDDGLPINSYYVTFGFVKSDMQDAKGLGLRRMLLAYLSFLAEGNGNLNVSIYTQSPQNIPFLLSSIPLSQFTLGDLEAAVNLTGERFFIRVGTNAVGSNFQLSKVVASLQKDAWSAIRGLAVANP